MVRRAFLCLFFCAVICWGATAEEEIRSAEKTWALAVKSGDIATLEKIFTPGLIYAHATGAIESKAKYLERLKSGKQRYSDVIHESTKIVIYGDTAVAHSIARTIGTNDQGPFNDHLMMMHFWVKQDGSWRLAAHQTTKIP